MNTLTNERLDAIRDLAKKATYKPCKIHETNLAEACDSEVVEEMINRIFSAEGKITQLLAQFPALKAAEAQLAESNQKAKNFEQVAHGMSGEVDALKAQLAASESRLHDVATLCATVEAQLAELRGQAPVAFQARRVGEADWHYLFSPDHADDLKARKRTGHTWEFNPLYARVPPAASQPVPDDSDKFDTAKLINKFYERYPLNTFNNDGDRAQALGYFMAGAELQRFGDFIVYEGADDDA